MPSNPTNNPASNRTTTSSSGSSAAGRTGGTAAGTGSTGSGAGAQGTGAATDASSRGMKDQAAEKVRAAGDQVKHQAQEKIGEARDQAMTRLRDGKSRVAGQVGTVAHAIRSASDDLRSEDQARLAEFTDSAAERIDRMARYLDERSLGELMDDVEQIARRTPTVFLGGAFALGLMAARFLKTSERRRRHDDVDTGTTDSYGAGSRTLPAAGQTTGAYASGTSYGTGAPASTTPASSTAYGTAPGTGGSHG